MIDNFALREALRSMGYTEVKQGHWIKPVGFQCFSFHENKNKWMSWFRSALGKVSCWESHDLNVDQAALGQIKTWEAYSRIDIVGDSRSEFQLGVKDVEGLW